MVSLKNIKNKEVKIEPIVVKVKKPVLKNISWWRFSAFIILIALLLWWLIVFIASLNSWKAVFIDNNQVYFGKGIIMPFSSQMTLRHVYYLQNDNTGTSTAVVKALIEDVHAPRDILIINRDHILYTEELRGDSPLAQGLSRKLTGK